MSCSVEEKVVHQSPAVFVRLAWEHDYIQAILNHITLLSPQVYMLLCRRFGEFWFYQQGRDW